MDRLPVADRLPPFGKSMLGCSNLAVTHNVVCLARKDGKWHLAFGDGGVRPITHWMDLPELPSLQDGGVR